VVEHEEKGKRTLALVEAYTDDGGHLNAIGQDWVARALLSYLASLR
jgi:lysophospholipase L1-like esterase